MKVLIPLVVVAALFALGLLGAVPGLGWVFGVVIPYLAVALFVGGLIHRLLSWAGCAVPFRITTTCGQQKSHPWIKQANLDNPDTGLKTIGRMALEVLFFRSLLRNTKTQLVDGHRLVYATDIALWLGAMIMHWSFLIVLIRHLRLVTEPVPWFVSFLEKTDGFFELAVPTFFISSLLLLGSAAYLLLRRLFTPQVRYISLIGDYFPLFLILGIALSGLWMRHFAKTDIVGAKEIALGLVAFRPTVPATVSGMFFGHLFLVSVLLAYFPFSKLVHMPGVFLSPTRNLANNNRRVRHVNPWDYPVKLHPYEEYEDELRDKMKGAGIPVEKQ
jgi:nitrate reductase gamma subunit